MTSNPSGRRAFGTHRYRCAGSATISETGRAFISGSSIVAYRLSLRCSGAIFPVLFTKRHGGSAKIVWNLVRLAVARSSSLGRMVMAFPTVEYPDLVAGTAASGNIRTGMKKRAALPPQTRSQTASPHGRRLHRAYAIFLKRSDLSGIRMTLESIPRAIRLRLTALPSGPRRIQPP